MKTNTLQNKLDQLQKLYDEQCEIVDCSREQIQILKEEVARLKRCEEASIQMRDYLVDQIIPEADSGEPVGGMLKYALENTQWWDWEIRGRGADERAPHSL